MVLASAPPVLIDQLSAEAVIMGLHFLGLVKLTEIPDGEPGADGDSPF
jgi:hypothetical protein